MLNIDMQSFQEYCSVLESLETSYPWQMSQRRDADVYEAVFHVPIGPGVPKPLRYTVSFARHNEENIPGTDEPWWEFTFAAHGEDSGYSNSKNDANWSQDITHTGHAFTIFATVIAIMKAFIAKQQPAIINFSAYEPSRQRLYDRFIKNVSSAISGYRGVKITTAMARANGYGPNGPEWLTPNDYLIVNRKISLKMV